MFNNTEKMKSFSLDIPVLKETIAKLENSIQNIEKIGNDVECNANALVSESWEGQATKSFIEHNQSWKKGYDEMVNQLIAFKESLEKVVLARAEEINDLALELPTTLGGTKGTGYRNILSMEQEGIEELKTKCKTLVNEDYECQREIMGKIEILSNRLNYSFSIGAAASKNKRIIEENQEKLHAFKGKLQNYEDRVLQFEKEVVDEMSKYAVICGHKLNRANFREVLKYQKDDGWKALLLKNIEELSDIEKLVLKAEGVDEDDLGFSSDDYIDKMKKMALYCGNINAMEQLMKDVKKNPTSFMRLKYSNEAKYDKFLNLVNELAANGIQTKEFHYFRNELNKAPNSLDELLKNKEDWRLLTPEQSMYHMNGQDGEYNLKLVSVNGGHFEAVYNSLTGELITNEANMGTYNYLGPDNIAGHCIKDVLPYNFFGNTDNTKARWNESKIALDNFEKFKQNPKAQLKYEYFLKKNYPQEYKTYLIEKEEQRKREQLKQERQNEMKRSVIY